MLLKTLKFSYNSHEECLLVIDKEQNCLKIKEYIKAKEKIDRLIEHEKNIGMDKIFKQNEKSLKVKCEV